MNNFPKYIVVIDVAPRTKKPTYYMAELDAEDSGRNSPVYRTVSKGGYLVELKERAAYLNTEPSK